MRLPDPAQDPAYYSDLLPKRAFAWAIDAVLVLLAVILLGILTMGMLFTILPVAMIGVAVAYRYVFITRYDATLGMRLASIRLRKLDGERPDPGTVLAHAAIHSICTFLVVPQIASIGMMFTTPYRQGLHDRLLGTTMVHNDPEFDTV